MCSDADGHKTIGRSNIAGTLLDVYHKRVDVHDYIIDTAKYVIEKDGVAGLFGRGLRTRIIAINFL